MFTTNVSTEIRFKKKNVNLISIKNIVFESNRLSWHNNLYGRRIIVLEKVC